MTPAERTELDLWPYEEARRLAERVGNYPPRREVIFESGFGPSGLPHLGTMGEVLRPAYVQHAFKILGEANPTGAAYRRASRLIVFIDDMDGLRKVPESIPNREATAPFLGQPVSQIPDPFGECHPSFAAHMIGLLEKFLEPVEVSYELMRSSEMYAGGRFDDALKLILERHAEIIRIVTPTLREENRAGWSPVMPLCPTCGQINSTLVTAYHPERASVEFSCERAFGGSHGCGFKGERSVLGGKAKVQWKVDWALRWYVLQVDYELYGKDLIDSARLSGQILRLLGGRPPLGFPFEMYLDEEGHKVSKSIGRGVGVEQWRRYAPIEVLKYFLILNPRRARKLFLESIPQYTDEYLDALRVRTATEDALQDKNSGFNELPDIQLEQMYKKLRNELLNSELEFVLQKDSVRRFESTLSFGLLMNLVAALGTTDRLFISTYLKVYEVAITAGPETQDLFHELIDCAINFYRDFIEPTKRQYTPTESERTQLSALVTWLKQNAEADAVEIEQAIYELGRQYYDKPGKIFSLLYRVILGQERGPRLGTFIWLATPGFIIFKIISSVFLPMEPLADLSNEEREAFQTVLRALDSDQINPVATALSTIPTVLRDSVLERVRQLDAWIPRSPNRPEAKQLMYLGYVAKTS